MVYEWLATRISELSFQSFVQPLTERMPCGVIMFIDGVLVDLADLFFTIN